MQHDGQMQMLRNGYPMGHKDETRARTGGGEKDRHLERLRLDDLRTGASSGG